ncbi:hypothetical protein FJZ36_11525 [Candidatus Poribacteria bacterium]|nr:hypothetical protein [Candidatus Poribacteria bacterium]
MRYAIRCFCVVVVLALSAMPVVAAQFEFLDIQSKANSKLVGFEWWTGNAGDSTLSKLPIGKATDFEGPEGKVQFLVGEKAVVLNGTNAAKWPKEITGFAVGGKAKAIYFLHATGWSFAGAISYKFILHYDDKSKEELGMQSDVNSRDWCAEGQALADKNSVWGWQLKEGPPCGHAGLITTKWANPKSGTTIASLDMVSLGTAAVPIIAAVTLGDASLSVDPRAKVAAVWGAVKTYRQ